jgi:hypothetical protein
LVMGALLHHQPARHHFLADVLSQPRYWAIRMPPPTLCRVDGVGGSILGLFLSSTDLNARHY